MKRAMLVGAIAFSLGAMESPRAANENETLSLLCKRFKDAAGEQIMGSIDYEMKKAGKVSDADTTLYRSLNIMKRMVCAR